MTHETPPQPKPLTPEEESGTEFADRLCDHVHAYLQRFTPGCRHETDAEGITWSYCEGIAYGFPRRQEAAARSATPSPKEAGAVWNAAYNLIREYDMQTGASGMHHRVEALRAALATPDNAGRSPIDDLRVLSEAATPGPWGAYISYSGESGTPDEAGLFVNDRAHDVDGEKQTIISDFSLYASEHLPDLEFIAAAVNYVRAALASTERAATPDNAGRSSIEKEAPMLTFLCADCGERHPITTGHPLDPADIRADAVRTIRADIAALMRTDPQDERDEAWNAAITAALIRLPQVFP